MKKIIVLASTFPRWENDSDPPFVYELSKRLTRSFEVHVLAPHYPGAAVAEEMEGMRVHRFRYFSAPFERLAGATGILSTIRGNFLYAFLVPFFVLGELVFLFRLVKKIKPAAVHAHWLVPQGWVAAWVSRVLKVPFLVTVHGGDVFGLRMAPAVAAKRVTLRRAAAVTVVSRAIARAVKDISPVEPIVLPMGVDSYLFTGEGDGRVRERFGISGPFLLFVGRLSEKKGVRYLLRAMVAVVARFPGAKLLVVGSGEEGGSLMEMSSSLGLGGNVVFAGAMPNRELPEIYAAADIFIGPSVRARGGDTEGFGLTFVEAGMSGCILIGSDVGGIGDIIRPGETGFLVPEKSPSALAAAIIDVLANKNDWPEMKKEVREDFVGRFDWAIIAEKYRTILAAIIER